MEITGRLTSDAVIADVTNTDRKVVNFTVAINDRYRAKGSTETKEYVTYINCAYWMGTGVAKLLTKGSCVTVTGRLHLNTYLDREGKAKGAIRCHANDIKVLLSKKQGNATNTTNITAVPAGGLTEPLDDLPF